MILVPPSLKYFAGSCMIFSYLQFLCPGNHTAAHPNNNTSPTDLLWSVLFTLFLTWLVKKVHKYVCEHSWLRSFQVIFSLFARVQHCAAYVPETTRYIPIFINKRCSALLNLLLYSKPPTDCYCSAVSQSAWIKNFIQKIIFLLCWLILCSVLWYFTLHFAVWEIFVLFVVCIFFFLLTFWAIVYLGIYFFSESVLYQNTLFMFGD